MRRSPRGDIPAHEWYLRDRARKKAMSRLLRAAAVLLGAADGLQPPVSVAAFGKSSSWGYVLLALAGVCVGFDYFLGLSSDWLRNMLTAQRIQRRIHRFQIDWAAMDAEHATAAGSAPLDVQRYLDALRAFLTDISDIMTEETSDWAAEVQTDIARLQGQTKAGATRGRRR